MEVILAQAAGFCYGVKRACQVAFEAAQTHTGGVSSLGPIIHNPQMVSRLAEAGLRVIEDLDAARVGAVLIRSHGVPPEVLEKLRDRGFEVVDATCPLVQRAQKLAKGLAAEGYRVVVVGEPEHPEVRALVAWADSGLREGAEGAVVVQSAADVARLKRAQRIGAVAQTTQIEEEYVRLVGELLKRTDELKAHNTICDATAQRQAAMLALLDKVDGMVVIGGRNSANTTRLFERCREKGGKAWHIETAEELDPAWFAGMSRVGVTAGASTPDWIIEEVVERLRSF
ncbi:MAG: 4-hydroxy-3-methylbut-2-enyl diphosphate reductase [bacterium]|nr:4-hydroxy-3-methylbut-2-enyl diphosphate reductase [bacterium]